MLNSDNYYPVEAYRALVALDGPGLVAFERDAMIRDSNVPADRVRQFAVVRIGADGAMLDVIEKPDEDTLASFGDEVYVSMNCWRFDTSVLDACRRVPLSARGELELTDAVRLARQEAGTAFRVVRMNAGVLDLSSRGGYRRRRRPVVGRRRSGCDGARPARRRLPRAFARSPRPRSSSG